MDFDFKGLVKKMAEKVGNSLSPVSTSPYMEDSLDPYKKIDEGKQFLANLGYNTLTGEARKDVSAGDIGGKVAETAGIDPAIGQTVGSAASFLPLILSMKSPAALEAVETKDNSILSNLTNSIKNLINKKKRGEILTGRQQQFLDETMKEESRVIRNIGNRQNK